MTQKQAEAAGVGMKPKSKAPEVLKDPAAIVILARRKEKEEKKRQVALLVYERVAEEKEEEEEGKRKNETDDSFEMLDLGLKLKREVHHEMQVEGLPSSNGGYTVMDVLAWSGVLKRLFADQSRVGDLDVFVTRLLSWAQNVLRCSFEPQRKVLMLKKKVPDAVKLRRAAEGTSASQLPENVLGQIANLGGGGSRPPPKQVKEEKQAPLIQVLGNEREKRKKCISSHEIQNISPSEMKVKAKLDEDFTVSDVNCEKEEEKLLFTVKEREGKSDYEVALPPGYHVQGAKYSKSSHKLTVKLVKK